MKIHPRSTNDTLYTSNINTLASSGLPSRGTNCLRLCMLRILKEPLRDLGGVSQEAISLKTPEIFVSRLVLRDSKH